LVSEGSDGDGDGEGGSGSDWGTCLAGKSKVFGREEFNLGRLMIPPREARGGTSTSGVNGDLRLTNKFPFLGFVSTS
jgi:hypothetical protein